MKCLFSLVILSSVSLQAQGHMLLWKPWRFNQTGDNSPLVGPGEGTSNYPCKVMGNYEFDFPRTQIPAGSQYTAVFEGQSVHGGGSCQFALSKDLEPNAQSEFKVIHSIEGGCPARNTPGNLGADDDWEAIDPFTYNFTMPSNIPTGNYTFAWSWFNKIGNREMYMNCAPIEVTAGSQKRSISSREAASALDSLPNLFLANIPDVQCLTVEEMPPQTYGDMSYPDPGNSIEQNVPANQRSPPDANGGDIKNCYAPVKTSSSDSSSSSSGSSSGSSGYGSSGSGSGYGAAVSSSTQDPSYTPTTTAAGSSASAPYPLKNSSAPPVSRPGSGSCASGQVSCSTSGTILCIGSSQFGICNNGCAIPQPLAAGTSCSAGVITKRDVRFPPHARPNRIYSRGHRVSGLL